MLPRLNKLAIFALVSVIPNIVFAQNTGDCGKSSSLWQSFGGGGLLKIFPQYCNPELTTLFILRTLILLVGVVATVAIMWSGYIWMTAAGDPNKMKKARQGIMYSAIGLIVVLLSSVIITFVTGLVSGNASSSTSTTTTNNGNNLNSTNNSPKATASNISAVPTFTYTKLNGKDYKKISVALATENSVLTSLCGNDSSTFNSNLIIDGSPVIQDTFQLVSDNGYTSTLVYSQQLFATPTSKSVDVKVCGQSAPGFPQDIDFGPQ